MEGEPHFQFRRVPRPGCCPVAFCRRKSRSGGAKVPRHRLCSTHCAQLWRLLNPWRAAYNTLKYHARERGKEFSITFAQFVKVVGMQGYVDGKGKQRHMLTLDREDPTLGYEPGNIRVITNGANVAKQHDDTRAACVAAKVAQYKYAEEPF